MDLTICTDAERKTKYKPLFILFSSVVILLLTFSFAGSQKTYADTSFRITYSEPVCGEPMTFSVELTNPTSGSTYKYYLNSVSTYTDGVYEAVIDSSRLTGYVDTNTFSFTFYASGTYMLRFYVMEKTASGSISYSYDNISFVINDPDYPSVETIADRIIASMNAEGITGDYEKALWLHDYIISHMRYDYSFSYCGTEGALARGLGTCEAYHRGYTALLKRAGIEYGRIENRTKLYHVWTAVKMEGDWYQVDCTWDDQDGAHMMTPFDEHFYFGANDDIMNGRSTPNYIAGETGAISNALKCNYLIKSGNVHQYSDIYVSTIQDKLGQGVSSFTIPVTNGFNDEYYYNENNAIFYPVAWQLSNQNWAVNGREAFVDVSYDSLVLTVNATYGAGTELSLTLPPGYSDSEVYIDGVSCNGTVSDGILKLDLDNTSARTAVAYRYNASGVPTGMYVWKLNRTSTGWTATALSGLENLISYHGFSIRITGQNGIRFKSGIDSSTKARLKTTGVDGYKIVEVGSIYMNETNLSTYPFIKGGAKVSNPGRALYKNGASYTDNVFETVNGRDRFANVLTGLPENRYATNIAFRAYVILEDSSGSQITIYGPIVSKSIYLVAKQLMERGDFSPGSGGYAYIEAIISTVESGS